MEFRARAAAARPRPDRAEPRGRLPALPGARARRHQARSINGPFTFAPDGNPLVGPVRGLAQLLGRLRRDGGIQPGRRRRPRAVELDGRRRSGLRRLGDGRRALRRLGDAARTRNAKVRENYSRRFRIRFPNEELPAARPLRTTPIYDRLKAQRRGVRRGLRPRARAVVRAAGHRAARGRHLPPLERARPGRRRMPRGAQRRRAARDRRPSPSTRSRAPARGAWLDRAARQPAAARRPARAVADAERQRQADRRLHRRATPGATASSCSARASPSSITCAGSRRICREPAWRCVRSRDEWLGFAIAGPRSRELLRGLPTTTSRRRRSRSSSFREMEVAMAAGARRRGSRSPASSATRSGCAADCQLALYDAIVDGGRRSRPRALRRARAALAAAREELRQLGARVPADLHARARPASIASSISASPISSAARRSRATRATGPARRLVTFVVDAARRRRDRRRADLARRQGRRLDHLGRLRPLRRQVDRARLRSRRARRRADARFEIEILGERRAATLAPQPLYDPAGERMRRS